MVLNNLLELYDRYNNLPPMMSLTFFDESNNTIQCSSFPVNQSTTLNNNSYLAVYDCSDPLNQKVEWHQCN